MNWQDLSKENLKSNGFLIWMTEEEIQEELENIEEAFRYKRITNEEKLAAEKKVLKVSNLYLIPEKLLHEIPLNLKVVDIKGNELVYTGDNLIYSPMFGVLEYGIKL